MSRETRKPVKFNLYLWQTGLTISCSFYHIVPIISTFIKSQVCNHSSTRFVKHIHIYLLCDIYMNIFTHVKIVFIQCAVKMTDLIVAVVLVCDLQSATRETVRSTRNGSWSNDAR